MLSAMPAVACAVPHSATIVSVVDRPSPADLGHTVGAPARNRPFGPVRGLLLVSRGEGILHARAVVSSTRTPVVGSKLHATMWRFAGGHMLNRAMGAFVTVFCLASIATVALTGQTPAPAPPVPAPAGDSSAAGFTAHTIDTDLTGGYQVVISDLNRDGKPDIIALALGLKELRWYENPGWQKHVLVTGINQAINAAVYDVDGDGIPEIALAQEFSNVYGKSLGIVSILTHQGDPTGPWAIKEIDRVPTSHRLRFADIDGSGKKVLVSFPLIGAQSLAPDYRDHVPLLMYRPGEWKREVITDAEQGIVHGIMVTAWDGGKRESLLSGSFLGVHLLEFKKGQWQRTLLTRGDPADWPKNGSSDVVAGRLGRERFLATIEPWHGNKVAVYRQNKDVWTRHVIDDAIGDGHTIVAGDFDGDGRDELIVGERQGKRSTYLYRITDVKKDSWSKQPLDDGGMSGAGCAVADLNADKRLDVICIGTATTNVKWYENKK
jgi:hypothetical protein